jgi:hypothetical protein
VPGVQVTDVQELIDNGSEVVILSRGMHLVLQTPPETIDYLSQRGSRCTFSKPRPLWRSMARSVPRVR